jgi:hypothetical protein
VPAAVLMVIGERLELDILPPLEARSVSRDRSGEP